MKKLILILAVFIAFQACSTRAQTVSVNSVKKDFHQYNGKVIKIRGLLDMSHFETVNLEGISIDWACYNSEKPNSGRASWERFDRWNDAGFNNDFVEIEGELFVNSVGKCSSFPIEDHLTIHKIKYIKSLKSGNTFIENCSEPCYQ